MTMVANECGTAAGCVRTIDKDRRCRLGNDRMAMMTQPPRDSCAGPSLLEMLWERLLEAYDELLQQQSRVDQLVQDQEDSQEPTGSLQDAVHEDVELGLRRGTCFGLATAISIIINPYAPDVDAVRAECAERYELTGEESSG